MVDSRHLRSLPDPTAPAVVAVVVTHNSAGDLPGFFSALDDGFDSVDYELILVDNCSTDDTLAVAEQLAPTVRIVRSEDNAGYAAGINRGAASAGGADALLVLNPDVRLGFGCVRRLLTALDEPGVGIAVPRLVDESGRVARSLRRAPTVARAWGEALFGGRAGYVPGLGEVVQREGAYLESQSPDWATGAAMLVSAGCRAETGPWDESFFLYSEETDFALRAADRGWTVRFVPEALAVHGAGQSNVQPELWALLMRNRLRLFARRHGAARSTAFKAALLLGEALRSIRGSPVHRRGFSAVLAERVSPQTPGYVCFSAQDWWYFNQAHSDFQLGRNLARHRRVLMVNSIGMRMPLPGRSSRPVHRVVRKMKSIAKLLRRPVADLPQFYVMSPVVLPLYGLRAARIVNAAIVRWQVFGVARLLGMPRPACLVTIPTAWDVVAPVPRHSLIYNRSDRHSEFGEAPQRIIRGMELQLLERADHVVYVSRTLMELESSRTEERAFFLDHGVDLGHFDPGHCGPEPADLASIPHPRLGFFGELESYTVDFELIRKLATAMPDCWVVLIGNSPESIDHLAELPNVRWLGPKPYADIPAYGAGFDVALMPWRDNEWIRYSNPIKLKEYLALGLPVVSTHFDEVDRYADLVSVASHPDDFVARGRDLLAHDSPEARARRRAAVAHDSWERRARTLIALAEGLEPVIPAGGAGGPVPGGAG